MRAIAIVMTLLAGCCPCGEIEVVEGDERGTVRAGEAVQLRATFGDDWEAGPGRCGGYWYVNHVLGGTEELGTIDACGRYQAPAVFPEGMVEIFVEAAEHAYDSCADCCPYAAIHLRPEPATAAARLPGGG